MQLTTSQLTTLRNHPHSTKLWLSIYKPPTLLACLVNGALAKGAVSIPYDTVSSGDPVNIDADMTMLIGTSAGSDDVGRIRVRSIVTGTINVAENSLDWQNNQFLTVLQYVDVNAVYPRIIQDPADPESVIFFKDDDIAYVDQNSVLGSFVNMGSHRAAFLENGSAQIYYSATGTYNVKGDALTYLWDFEGGTPTGSTAFEPGYVTYATTGHKRTKLTVTNASGGTDVAYRYVSIYNRPENGTFTPILNWEFDNLSGSRSEGGYTLSLRVRENIDKIQPNALIVLFADDSYGVENVSLGGTQKNNEKIVFVGYVLGDTITYDYQTSSVEFSAGSISDMMMAADGFSVSCESKATPATWFEIQEMTVAKAIYHYLRWHSTVLKVADLQYIGDDRAVQYFDSERTSLYNAIDSFVRGGMLGELVSDRQGKLWAEVTPAGTTNPLSKPVAMNILKQDWIGTPSIREARSSELSFVEMGGIAYSGATTGTFSAIISNAPTASPLYRGKIEKIEGLILLGQNQLNSMAGHYLATKNSKFPEIGMSLAGNYRNLDIAPFEFVKPFIAPEDTYRNTRIQDEYYNVERMDWSYDASKGVFAPEVTLLHTATGTAGVTIEFPDVPDDSGFNVPGIQIPALPPLTFPSFAVGASATGSSCCDNLVNMGYGGGVYSVLLTRVAIVDPLTVGGESGRKYVGWEFASNPKMYDAITGKIPLQNTGTITYSLKLEGEWEDVGVPGYTPGGELISLEVTFFNSSDVPLAGGITIFVAQPSYNGAGTPDVISTGFGSSGVFRKTIIYINNANYVYPAYATASVVGSTSPLGFNVLFDNLRLQIIGTP